jgi:Cu(I)/Ag(I) efflux system membrane fusion protein
VIHSPVAGVVIKKEIDIGHYVVAGEDPWTLADDSLLWLQAQVFERDLGLVKEGQLVEVTTEAYPGKTFAGKVAFVAPEVQPDTRTVKARVEIPNPQGQLKGGQYVTAVLRVPLGKAGEVFYGC